MTTATPDLRERAEHHASEAERLPQELVRFFAREGAGPRPLAVYYETAQRDD